MQKDIGKDIGKAIKKDIGKCRGIKVWGVEVERGV